MLFETDRQFSQHLIVKNLNVLSDSVKENVLDLKFIQCDRRISDIKNKIFIMYDKIGYMHSI